MTTQPPPVSQPFHLGCNYWPRRKAMYWWSNFEAEEVREEFDIIAELGLKIVRIFLLWDDFQPTPTTVSDACLRHLATVADIAASAGLLLDVTFFTGHMSGPNWSPGWLLGGPPLAHVNQLVSGGQVVESGYRNPYSDPVALDAQRLQLRSVVRLLRDHPGVYLWNLGNEPDLFAWPKDSDHGQAWVREMTGIIKEIDPVHPVTCGLHVASLHLDNGLRVDKVFAETDIAVMHAYPMYLPWGRGPLDPDLVPFTTALTASLSGKPTLMEEFGGCTALPGQDSYVWEWEAYGKPRTQFMASEAALAEYIEAVLPRLVEIGAIGAMVWCYADYIEALWGKPPCSESRHERFFGLVRPDGTLKPHAEVLRKFAATQPTVRTDIPAWARPVVTGHDYYTDPTASLLKLYPQYLAR
jgi:endo-1,4-beta-mannosidase